MKAKYKVGDKVRILDGSKIERHRGGFTSGMKDLVGKICTIADVSSKKDMPIYCMKEVGYMWDERGLAPADEKIVIYPEGNKVIAKEVHTGKTAVAKCNPQDAFDFTTGARLAFDRLTGAETGKEYIPVLKQKKYEVGDKVLIVSEWVKGCRENPDGEMDKWLGKVMTIRAIKDDRYLMMEDKHEFTGRGWYWFPPSIIGKVIDEREPDKNPLNTKIVFTKGDDIFKTGHIYEIKDGILKSPTSGDNLPRAKQYGGAFYSIEDVKDYFTEPGKGTSHDKGWSCETLEFIEVVDD